MWISFNPRMRKPLERIRSMIFPEWPARTASGLMIPKVRLVICDLVFGFFFGLSSLVFVFAFLLVSCGFHLNLHNRRDAKDAEVAQRVQTEPGYVRERLSFPV